MRAVFASLFILSVSVASSAHVGHRHPGGTHLTFADGAIHAHAVWEQGPRSRSESILRIEWKNGHDHSPTEPPGEFKVSLWMPDHGHGSAPTRIHRIPGDDGEPLVGVYRVSNIYFTMGGKWDVNVTLKTANGVAETKSIKVEIHGGGHDH